MKVSCLQESVYSLRFLAALLGGAVPGLSIAAVSEESAPERGFVVSGSFDQAPYQFIDESGKPAGFDVDLIKAVSRAAGLKAMIQKPGPAGEFAPDVRLGASFAKDSVRQSEAEVWQYLEPHSTREHAVFVREDSLCRKLEDLSGRDVLVTNGSHAREWLSRHGYRDHLISVASPAGALALLSQGNYEAFVGDRHAGLQACLDNGIGDVRMLKDPVIPVETGFALLRHDTELAAALESGMRVVRKTGEYDTLVNRWLTPLEPSGTELKLGAAYSYALWIIVPAILFLASALIGLVTVKKKTLARIQELERELAAERERNEELEMEHARQRYVINQMSAVSLVEQLAGVSGSRGN